MVTRTCCVLWAALSGWAATTAADLAALAVERGPAGLCMVMGAVALADAPACVVVGRWAVEPRRVSGGEHCPMGGGGCAVCR